MLLNIPYITLWAIKFDEMTSFYKQILGLPVKYQSENFIQFETSGTELYIHKIMEEDASLRKHTVEIHFEVPDVDVTYAELTKKGVRFEQLPMNMPWGTRITSFRDPEGYVIELVGPVKQGEGIAHHPS